MWDAVQVAATQQLPFTKGTPRKTPLKGPLAQTAVKQMASGEHTKQRKRARVAKPTTYAGITIAIDGPCGVGKSTAARALARRLGYVCLDSGALFRAVALAILQSSCDMTNEEAVAQFATATSVEQVSESTGQLLETRTLLNGIDVTDKLRQKHVGEVASIIGQNPAVRKHLLSAQKQIAASALSGGTGIVAEGRDATTAVFPDADMKIFLHASTEKRVERRLRELTMSVSSTQGTEELCSAENAILAADCRKEISERDARDTATMLKLGPWPNPLAMQMDTSTLPAASVAEELFQLALGSGALPQLDRPLLLCMCGAPGAGKTTIARTLAASAPAHLECNMVRFDDVDAIIDLRTAAGEAAAEAFDGMRLAAARADALALVAKTLSTSRVTNCGRQSIVVVDDTMHHQVCHNQN